jgi:hypothetical protein
MQESIEILRTELEERLRFETLLAETSARFVNLPADQIEDEIEDTQRRICEFLNLPGATVIGDTPPSSTFLLYTTAVKMVKIRKFEIN